MMSRGQEHALCRELRPRRSLVKQMQLGTLWSLILFEYLLSTWKYEEEGKVQKRQAVADQLAETRMKAYSCGQVQRISVPEGRFNQDLALIKA